MSLLYLQLSQVQKYFVAQREEAQKRMNHDPNNVQVLLFFTFAGHKILAVT